MPPSTSSKHRPAFDYAVAIGRFQPVHRGHVALLQTGLQMAHRLVVLAGSAGQARSPKNPFTWQERAAMLQAALPEQDRTRLRVLGLQDRPGRDADWVAAVEAAVQASMRADGANPASARVALVGHVKDASSYYLRLFAHWQWVPVGNVAGINATDIRASYLAAESGPDALWQQAAIVPPSTVAFLQGFRQTSAWQTLRQAWQRQADGSPAA
ncbi:MAG: adenylyltransferase/cytidyltransferase family protein [Brachymonas sp.]|nr:adenylyltransferase/cytidyltransferase family protein [Brachymonas sp.]